MSAPVNRRMINLSIMLENLLDYPVATTGLVTAPTGIDTTLAMLVRNTVHAHAVID